MAIDVNGEDTFINITQDICNCIDKNILSSFAIKYYKATLLNIWILQKLLLGKRCHYDSDILQENLNT